MCQEKKGQQLLKKTPEKNEKKQNTEKTSYFPNNLELHDGFLGVFF